MHLIKNLSLLFLLVFAISCDSSPKVIETNDGASSAAPASGILNQAPGAAVPAPNMDEHKVVVREALNTDRYTYLRVNENDQEFWIAIPKKEVKIGGTYYYRGGLLKRNFESKEFNRVFESVYLVSDVSPEPIGAMPAGGILSGAGSAAPMNTGPIKVTPAPGGITIKDLVKNMQKYDGKIVKITGQCVKINPMIMNRNWIHLKDGTSDDYDLTITTTEEVQLGAVVTLEGRVALNKDFGAGYKYELIVEGASLK